MKIYVEQSEEPVNEENKEMSVEEIRELRKVWFEFDITEDVLLLKYTLADKTILDIVELNEKKNGKSCDLRKENFIYLKTLSDYVISQMNTFNEIIKIRTDKDNFRDKYKNTRFWTYAGE